MSDFDLTPDPRVLQMLGEINLDQWKCVAELIDNSVDGHTKSRAAGTALPSPQISVALPTSDREDAAVTVRDNGPGMDAVTLEKAVRAGWTGNAPFDSLGLFGMGFNIATARLGLVTEVWTTREGDLERTGLRIDLDDLRRSRRYHTPRLTQPKMDASQHGTEIIIRRLKPEQRAFFAKSASHQRIKKRLQEVYAPLLLEPNNALRIDVNASRLAPRRLCFWDPSRSTVSGDGSPVSAVQEFDFQLSERTSCSNCMAVFHGIASECPQCGATSGFVVVTRRVRGWIGLQRYLDAADFGIDMIRNGRVIEVRNKELFTWSDGDSSEREYPIDDPRNRGRFIGQIHIDHCRVSYTKDRFEREDPSWAEMVTLIRGSGPLQPNKAAQLGYGANVSPLYRLFQVFRRTSPQGKAGRWTRILVVKDNDRAVEMAAEFEKGTPEYQSDDRWWQLVQEQDASLVGGPMTGGGASGVSPVVGLPPGLLASQPTPAGSPAINAEGSTAGSSTPSTSPPIAVSRRKVLQLSRTFEHSLMRFRFVVDAFSTEPGDPGLPRGAPWHFTMDDPATGTYIFIFDAGHAIFRSETLTPIDGLLVEIASKIVAFVNEQPTGSVTLAVVLADLRARYITDRGLAPTDILQRAQATIVEIARSISQRLSPEQATNLFESLSDPEKQKLRHKIASSGLSDFGAVIRSGEFLGYAEASTVSSVVRNHPELFFDGNYWEDKFIGLEFGDGQVNALAREKVLWRYEAYLTDASWLLSLSPADFDRASRDQVVRATQSLRLLRADRE